MTHYRMHRKSTRTLCGIKPDKRLLVKRGASCPTCIQRKRNRFVPA